MIGIITERWKRVAAMFLILRSARVLASTHDVHGRKSREINGDIIPPYWRQL